MLTPTGTAGLLCTAIPALSLGVAKTSVIIFSEFATLAPALSGASLAPDDP